MRDIPFLLQILPPPSREWANLGAQEYGKNVHAVMVGAVVAARNLNSYEMLAKEKAEFRGYVMTSLEISIRDGLDLRWGSNMGNS